MVREGQKLKNSSSCSTGISRHHTLRCCYDHQKIEGRGISEAQKLIFMNFCGVEGARKGFYSAQNKKRSSKPAVHISDQRA
jgi:hypothetical protein